MYVKMCFALALKSYPNKNKTFTYVDLISLNGRPWPCSSIENRTSLLITVKTATVVQFECVFIVLYSCGVIYVPVIIYYVGKWLQFYTLLLTYLMSTNSSTTTITTPMVPPTQAPTFEAPSSAILFSSITLIPSTSVNDVHFATEKLYESS